jgi:energy-converting hydrogenase Eha subunit A
MILAVPAGLVCMLVSGFGIGLVWTIVVALILRLTGFENPAPFSWILAILLAIKPTVWGIRVPAAFVLEHAFEFALVAAILGWVLMIFVIVVAPIYKMTLEPWVYLQYGLAAFISIGEVARIKEMAREHAQDVDC